jgi:antitoxin HigA-1
MTKPKPVTLGDLLLEEFLLPMELSQDRLAEEIGVPAQWISEIVAGKRAITADTDLRLCRFFSLSSGYWLRAQAAYDTEAVAHTARLQRRRSELPIARSATGHPLQSLTGADTQRILDEEETAGGSARGIDPAPTSGGSSE